MTGSVTTSTERPHVALAITALHDVPGGAERVLVDVANGLHRRGYPVSVLTYQDVNGPSFYPLDYGIAHLDGRQRDAQWGGRGQSIGTFGGLTQRRRSAAIAVWLARYGPKVWHLRRLLKIARPDVAIGFLPSAYPYLTLAARGLRGVRTIASLHNVPDRDLGGDPKRWDPNPIDISIRRRTLEMSDGVTVLLPSFVEQLDEAVRSKTAVIPNLIHPYRDDLADVADEPDDGEPNTILAVGRLSPAKDHATLVRAWAQIQRRYPTWRLRIIGEGPLYDGLVDVIAELDVERITIDDPTSEIEAAYTSAKILAMPSVHEGFGLVTAEAMACGLPVIGFADCEGTNEIVVDGSNGLLVEPGDDRATAFAAAMARLIENEDERVRLAGGAPATVRAFEPEPVLDAWEALIDRVMAGSSR